MNRSETANRLFQDPRGQSESDWLDLLDYLVSGLSDATSCYLHLGTYWCDDFSTHAQASITGRVRSRSALVGVESDYWEAALCYTGNADRAYATAYVFPFLKGVPVTSRGCLQADVELDEYRLWEFTEHGFVDRGWSHPDGPGEWAWIQQPGDEYWQRLDVSLPDRPFAAGDSVIATIHDKSVPRSHREIKDSKVRVSLVHANRNSENTNLFPWGERPARPNRGHATPIQQAVVADSSIAVDLTGFKIRGGWKPGTYHVTLRVQNLHDRKDWTYTSDISPPFKLTVT